MEIGRLMSEQRSFNEQSKTRSEISEADPFGVNLKGDFLCKTRDVVDVFLFGTARRCGSSSWLQLLSLGPQLNAAGERWWWSLRCRNRSSGQDLKWTISGLGGTLLIVVCDFRDVAIGTNMRSCD